MRAALLELLVVFAVRDVALKKTALPGAGSLFAFLNIFIYIYIYRERERSIFTNIS